MTNIFDMFLSDDQQVDLFEEALDQRIDEIRDMTEEQAEFFAQGALTIIGIQNEVTRRIVAENTRAVLNGTLDADDAEFIFETLDDVASRSKDYTLDVRDATFEARGKDLQAQEDAEAAIEALGDLVLALLGGVVEAEAREEARVYAGV